MAASRARRVAGALLVVAAIATAGVAVPLVGTATAHISDPTILTVVDSVTPRLPGVVVQVAESVTPELVVGNTSSTVLTVLGDYGEPFLQIGPSGVAANLASQTWYLTNSPIALAAPPGYAHPGAAARWAQVSVQPSWGWFEHRMHVGADVLNHPVPRSPTVIKRWSVPLQYGDRSAVVRGRVFRRPLVGGYTARLRSLTPRVPGLGVQVSPGVVPALFLDYVGSASVVVIGAAGEPFARLEPGGVDVNRHSSTWIDNQRARDEDVSGLVADPAAAPDWSHVSDQATLAWLDPRGVIDRAAGQGSGPPRQRRWTVPLETGGSRAVLAVESGVQTR